MSNPARQQSPMVQLDLSPLAASENLQIIETPFVGHINLRGRPDNAKFIQSVAKVLGTEPPKQANTWTESGDFRIYWMGPDEWLIITRTEAEEKLEQDLRDALKGQFSSVTNVSSGQTLLRISGEKARALLQKGCSFDLHPNQFKPGQCAQTLLAKAGVLVAMVDDAPVFDLVVRRSFSDYLGLWLQDAAHEFL